MNASELLYKMSYDISSLGTGDKMFGASIVTLLSMGIVFGVLVLLMISVKALNFTVAGKKSMGIKGPVSQETVPLLKSSEATEEMIDEEELIAVISAAIAASMRKSLSEIRVVSVRRETDGEPIWAKNGRWNQMNGRL